MDMQLNTNMLSHHYDCASSQKRVAPTSNSSSPGFPSNTANSSESLLKRLKMAYNQHITKLDDVSLAMSPLSKSAPIPLALPTMVRRGSSSNTATCQVILPPRVAVDAVPDIEEIVSSALELFDSGDTDEWIDELMHLVDDENNHTYSLQQPSCIITTPLSPTPSVETTTGYDTAPTNLVVIRADDSTTSVAGTAAFNEVPSSNASVQPLGEYKSHFTASPPPPPAHCGMAAPAPRNLLTATSSNAVVPQTKLHFPLSLPFPSPTTTRTIGQLQREHLLQPQLAPRSMGQDRCQAILPAVQHRPSIGFSPPHATTTPRPHERQQHLLPPMVVSSNFDVDSVSKQHSAKVVVASAIQNELTDLAPTSPRSTIIPIRHPTSQPVPQLQRPPPQLSLELPMVMNSPEPTLLTLLSFPFRVICSNPAFSALTGQSAEEIMGCSFYDLILPPPPPQNTNNTITNTTKKSQHHHLPPSGGGCSLLATAPDLLNPSNIATAFPNNQVYVKTKKMNKRRTSSSTFAVSRNNSCSSSWNNNSIIAVEGIDTDVLEWMDSYHYDDDDYQDGNPLFPEARGVASAGDGQEEPPTCCVVPLDNSDTDSTTTARSSSSISYSSLSSISIRNDHDEKLGDDGDDNDDDRTSTSATTTSTTTLLPCTITVQQVVQRAIPGSVEGADGGSDDLLYFSIRLSHMRK